MTTGIHHTWGGPEEVYSIVESRWAEPDAPTLAIQVPFAGAKNSLNEPVDAYEVEFQLSEENARLFHRLIGSWLEEIHE
ncbi:MAG: hypothetical protein ACPHK8_03055 [Thermoplasmatota archaeon]